MNKTRNFFKSINVDKLTFIYINNRILNRFQKTTEKLQFAEINVDKEYFCEMKNLLLQKKTAIFSNEPFSSKKSINQQMTKNAVKFWTK